MKRPARNADEQDCFFASENYKYLEKPRKAARIKRRARRRERREAKQETDDQ